MNGRAKKLSYEQGTAEGYLATETFCLHADACIDEMLFISVHKTEGMNLALNGVLGLSPGSSQVYITNGQTVTNSFIE